MKEKSRKIAGIMIALAGVLEFVVGISEGTFSTILMGICFCIIGSLYFLKKENKI